MNKSESRGWTKPLKVLDQLFELRASSLKMSLHADSVSLDVECLV